MAWNHLQDSGRSWADGVAEVRPYPPALGGARAGLPSRTSRRRWRRCPAPPTSCATLHAAGVPMVGLTNWSDELYSPRRRPVRGPRPARRRRRLGRGQEPRSPTRAPTRSSPSAAGLPLDRLVFVDDRQAERRRRRGARDGRDPVHRRGRAAHRAAQPRPAGLIARRYRRTRTVRDVALPRVGSTRTVTLSSRSSSTLAGPGQPQVRRGGPAGPAARRCPGRAAAPPALTVSAPWPGIDDATFVENAEPETRPLPTRPVVDEPGSHGDRSRSSCC